jgi:hypothetical protein
MMQPLPEPHHHMDECSAAQRLAVGTVDAEIMGDLEGHIDDEEHGIVAESRVGAGSEPPLGATRHVMRRGAGRWQRKLLAHLDRYGAVAVGSVVKGELGRTPTRAETVAARFAAHGLADAGRLWLGYRTVGTGDTSPRKLWVFPVGSPRPEGVYQTHDERATPTSRRPLTNTRGANQDAKFHRTSFNGP